MTSVGAWLNRGPRRERELFRRVVEEHCDEAHGVRTGAELVELAVGLEPGSVDHLVVAAHGGPGWLLHSREGITTAADARRSGQATVLELTEAWHPVLTQRPLVSLAACLCSRSPSWWLRRYVGRITSSWGPRAYRPGGQASLAARVRDHLCWYGHYPRVHGHRAAGHATHLALLAEHRWPPAEQCEPLWALVHEGLKPTLSRRRRWVRLVTGELAERWLMGDASVVNEIMDRWG